MSEIIDMRPRLKLKAQRECKHEHVEIDDDAAELTCVDCEAPLDPWWYIRRQAHGLDDYEEWRVACRAAHDKWMASAEEQRQRLVEEVNALIETKNRLSNEQVNGAPLFAQVKRRRRRA